jgi:hypothetical protein
VEAVELFTTRPLVRDLVASAAVDLVVQTQLELAVLQIPVVAVVAEEVTLLKLRAEVLAVQAL